jgi:hypothetical protein
LKQATTSSSYIHHGYIDPTYFNLLITSNDDKHHRRTQEKEIVILAASSPSTQHIARVVEN